jgi:hypothetical protein
VAQLCKRYHSSRRGGVAPGQNDAVGVVEEVRGYEIAFPIAMIELTVLRDDSNIDMTEA